MADLNIQKPAKIVGSLAAQKLASGRASKQKRNTREGLLSVIGTDDRQRISQTEKAPWRMICSLRLHGRNDVFIGTGWMVGPKTVITAGHCIVDRGFRAEQIDVMPGRDGADLPFGTVTATRMDAHPEWRSGFNADRDVGVIHLDEPLGETTGWFGFAAPEASDLQGFLVNVAGYPGSAHQINRSGRELWWHKDAVDTIQDERIYYATDTTGGQSGSPIWTSVDEQNQPIVVGIHAYGVRRNASGVLVPRPDNRANSAPRIDRPLAGLIGEWIRESERAAVRRTVAPSPSRAALAVAPEVPSAPAVIVPDPTVSERDIHRMLSDETVPMEAIRPYLEIDQDISDAYRPQFRVRPEVMGPGPVPESALALNALNALSRRKRQRAFREAAKARPNGIRLVSDGDSWFLHPLIDDTINHLMKEHLVYSLDGAGDLMEDIVRQRQVLRVAEEIGAEGVLLSGGGNDLLGDGKLAEVLQHGDGQTAASYIRMPLFRQRIGSVLSGYADYIGSILDRFPSMHIFIHGYDAPMPMEDGKWVGEPMEGIVPETLQPRIPEIMIDSFNDALIELAADDGRIHMIDNRNVPPHPWFDEIHPKGPGYARVAARFSAAIRAALRPGVIAPEALDARGTGAEALPPLAEHLLAPVSKGAEAPAQRRFASALVERHGLTPELAPNDPRLGDAMAARPVAEVVLGERDFVPARFLSDGAARARAICRIVRTDGGRGTGSLLEGGFIMTNWHVLETATDATGAVAEFGFEAGGDLETVSLQPGRFFLSDMDRDFAIVACDTGGLEDVQPLRLPLNPAGLMRNQRVNIIQHPAGRPKEVAFRDNRIIDVFQGAIHYRTDTEPGSSGSPVFNDLWELVALHRAGLAGEFNQAIRIDAIAAFLEGQVRSGAAPGAAPVLEAIGGTAPQLGFFGRAGVIREIRPEVEIPTFQGDGEFADIGFWNIENFFGNVSSDRIDRIADLMARINMDAMGLIEVSEDSVREMVRRMNLLGENADFVFLNAGLSRDLAIVYDRDTTEVTRLDDVSDRHADLISEKLQGKRVFPRKPLIAKIDVGQGGAQFVMIVVHLKSKAGRDGALSANRRRRAAEALRIIADDIRETLGLPVLLGGDYNEDLTNDVLSGLTEAPDFFTLTADDEEDGAISYLSPRFKSLIDHVIVAGDLEFGDIMGDDLGIVRFDQSISDFAEEFSDHTPLVMRLIMRDEAVERRDDPAGEDGDVAIPIPQDARSLRLDFE